MVRPHEYNHFNSWTIYFVVFRCCMRSQHGRNVSWAAKRVSFSFSVRSTKTMCFLFLLYFAFRLKLWFLMKLNYMSEERGVIGRRQNNHAIKDNTWIALSIWHQSFVAINQDVIFSRRLMTGKRACAWKKILSKKLSRNRNCARRDRKSDDSNSSLNMHKLYESMCTFCVQFASASDKNRRTRKSYFELALL